MNRESQHIDRSGIYQDRHQKFLAKIRSFESEELKKINEKSNDEVQFETNKIISESRSYDQDQFSKKQKGLDIESKIKRSRKINESRLSKMKMRFEMIEKMQNEIKTKLLQSTSDVNKYKQLLQTLIIQGLIKMLEETVEVKCLAKDVGFMNEVLPYCENYFANICEVQTKLVLGQERLPDSELGGIVLTSFRGKIVCNNTLRARLDYAIQQSLPEVRRNLFPTKNTE